MEEELIKILEERLIYINDKLNEPFGVAYTAFRAKREEVKNILNIIEHLKE